MMKIKEIVDEKSRWVMVAVAAIVALVSLFVYRSCNSREEQERVTREQRRAAFVEDSLSLKVGILPTSDCDVIRLADSLGIFERLGVSVHLKEYDALSSCRNALRHNKVEGAVVDSVLASIIESKDTTKLVLTRPTSLSWKMISSKKSRVFRVAQLIDKVIGADSHGASHAMAESAIDSLLHKDHHVFVVQVESPLIRLDMLQKGNIDAAMLPEPFASQAIKDGHKVILDKSKETKGVVVFREKALKDERIRKQHELFLKAIDIATDSLKHYSCNR